MKNFTKILKEIVVLTIVLGVAITIGFFVVKNIMAEKGYVVLSGKVVKKDLSIVSPVFGSVESLPVGEGQLVKKGDTIAMIKFFNDGGTNIPNIDSSTFSLQGNEIKVISPVDAIVARELFAENSVLKPGADFMVLYPLKSVTINVSVPSDGSGIANYSSLFVIKDQKQYPIEDIKSLPIDQDVNGGALDYASFVKVEDSVNFYNGQTVTIKAFSDTTTSTVVSTPTSSPSPIHTSSPKPSSQPSSIVVSPTP